MSSAPGFEPDARSSPYLDLVGPVQQMHDPAGRLVIGLRVEHRHLNGRGLLHGALLAALGDVALGRAAALTSDPPAALLTVSLTTHFVAKAALDDWLEVRATTLRPTRTFVFAQGEATVAGAVVATFDAVFSRPPSRPAPTGPPTGTT